MIISNKHLTLQYAVKKTKKIIHKTKTNLKRINDVTVNTTAGMLK